MKVAACVTLLAFLGTSTAVAQLGKKKVPEHDQRVKKVLDDLKVKYQIDKDGDFRLVLPVDDVRTQVVFIRSKTSRYRNFEIREIFSVGYKSSTDTIPATIANRLLEHNSRVKLGAWERQKGYAIFRTKIAADADKDSLYSALKLTYEAADELEKEFTGSADKF